MADTTVGVVSYDVRLNLASLKRDSKEAESLVNSSAQRMSSSQKSLDNSLNSTTSAVNSSRASMIALGAATTAVAVAIGVNLDNAVARSDTLNNFPRVLTAMGESADDAQDATNKLAERLKGLPTSLQDGTQAVQGFIAAGLPVGVATEGFLALNNAFLASGASTEAASQSMTQLQQALSRGKIEGQEWNSIVANTPTFLKAMSNETGKTREELRELYATSPEKLIQDMIRLNTQGGGGLSSLDAQARAATDGIGTAFDNMNNAITRSIEGIIDGIGRDNITQTIDSIGQGFEIAGRIIEVFAGILRPLAPIITGVAVAIGLMTIAQGGITLATIVATKAMAAFRIMLNFVSAHPVVATLIILASVIAGVATAVGLMKDKVEDVEAPAIDVGDALEGWTPAINNSTDEAKKLEKQLAKIDEQIAKTNEDYRYRLAELVADKNNNIAKLQETLNAEKQAYDNAYRERLAGFDKSQYEEEKSHSKKVKALQTQIDFLTKYNNAANQQQLTKLKFALEQENAEYQKSTELRQGEFNAQTQSAQEEYEKRRAENQKKLDEELALLVKHRDEVLSVRGIILNDEIESLKKSRDEQLKSLQQQKADIIDNMTEAFKSAGSAAGSAFTWKLKESIQQGMRDGVPIYLQTYEKNGEKKQVLIGGYASGGYTGRGGENEPAGIVHKGEYVIPKNMVDQNTGLPYMDTVSTNKSANVNLTLIMSGIMSSSPSDERAIAQRMLERINEGLRSKGVPQIGTA